MAPSPDNGAAILLLGQTLGTILRLISSSKRIDGARLTQYCARSVHAVGDALGTRCRFSPCGHTLYYQVPALVAMNGALGLVCFQKNCWKLITCPEYPSQFVTG